MRVRVRVRVRGWRSHEGGVASGESCEERAVCCVKRELSSRCGMKW